jgi:hypothetical protein
MSDEPMVRVPRDFLMALAGAIAAILVTAMVMGAIYEHWRPKVLEWRAEKLNMGTWVKIREIPRCIEWNGVVYDCVKSEDQGTGTSSDLE